jgi:hypothetical protein
MRNGMITNKDGDQFWYQNNQRHRIDGPAVEYAGGERRWFQKDLLHRIDGPAIELKNGAKFWYINGVQYELNDWLNLVDFTEPQKTVMRLRYA